MTVVFEHEHYEENKLQLIIFPFGASAEFILLKCVDSILLASVTIRHCSPRRDKVYLTASAPFTSFFSCRSRIFVTSGITLH